MAKNSNLRAAKRAKQDEFYTQWSDIEKEMQAYLEYNPDVFRDKVILLPCDDPGASNFTKYFALNFEKFGLKKLISTSCAPRFNPDADKQGRIYVLERGEDVNEEDIKWGYLEGDGDFRSDEITELRDEADMVITNPPFSLFREFMAWLVEGDVKFSIVGNKNAITYKEVFPLIKKNKMWLGNGFARGNAHFRIPPELARDFAAGVYDEDTSTVHFRNIDWFTNIEHGRRHEPLILMTMDDNLVYGSKSVRETAYPHYDNYDAIEVPETKGIPSDYAGVMGVPISFLDKYSPEQFEILGATESEGSGFSEGLHDGGAVKQATVDSKRVYKRIFIRHRNHAIQSKSFTETNNIAA